MRNGLIAALVFFLSSCGVIYISPDVHKNNPNVEVVPLTMATISTANQSTYHPKSLPAVFFQGAGTGGGLRGAGAMPEPTVDRQVKPKTLPVRLPPSAPDLPYTIGVGDVVLLATPKGGTTVEELSGLLAAQNSRQGYTVQDDGAIAIPDVGRIALAGLTLEEAEARVFQKLVENQMDPAFSIEIAEFNSKRVSIGGAVGKPAIVPISLVSLTLEEALAAAGGIKARGEDYTSIRLYRDGTLYEVPLTEYYKRPSVQKTRLAAGDSIFVDSAYALDEAEAYFSEQISLAQFKITNRALALDELKSAVSIRREALEEERQSFLSRLQADGVDRDYVYLAGEIRSTTRFALPFDQTASLADAMFGEGTGIANEHANPAQVYVLRGQEGSDRVTAYHLNYRIATNLVMATKLQLRPDDVIFVAQQPVTRWDRTLSQIIPSLITQAATVATQ